MGRILAFLFKMVKIELFDNILTFDTDFIGYGLKVHCFKRVDIPVKIADCLGIQTFKSFDFFVKIQGFVSANEDFSSLVLSFFSGLSGYPFDGGETTAECL